VAEASGPDGNDPSGPIEAPESADRLYLSRGSDVDPYRPVMSGDVFKGRIETLDDAHELIMVMSHPCSMRAGAHLRPRLQVAPVLPRGVISTSEWRGSFKVMLLPDLQDEQSFAASLELNSPVRADELHLDARVASLSEYGILVLYQRHIRHLTRLEVGVRNLEPVTRAVFTEVALQDEWNNALARPRVESGEAFGEVMGEEEEAFDAFMASTGASGVSLRDELRNPYLHADVRRAVGREIERRRI
jgi:hypothetical protein